MEPWWHKYQVSLPEDSRGPWTIKKMVINLDDPGVQMANLRMAINGGGRRLRPGTITVLEHERREVVMSDTYDEIADHLDALQMMESPEVKRVLIAGLGLGMILRHALAQPQIERVDVVEIDQDVIDLVGPHYADPRLTIHNCDIFTWDVKAWYFNTLNGSGRRWRASDGPLWDLAWFDIWDTISADNTTEFGVLRKKFPLTMVADRQFWAESLCKHFRQAWRQGR